MRIKASGFCLAPSLMCALCFQSVNQLLIAWYFLSTDQLESLEAEDQRDPTSPASTSPMSRDSSPEPASRPPSQLSSTSQTSSRPGSQPPSSPDSRSNTSANSNTKKSSSKTSKPAHLRRNIRYGASFNDNALLPVCLFFSGGSRSVFFFFFLHFCQSSISHESKQPAAKWITTLQTLIWSNKDKKIKVQDCVLNVGKNYNPMKHRKWHNLIKINGEI